MMRPFFNISNSLKENDLKNKNAELEAKLLSLSQLEKENNDLKSLLSRVKNPQNYILANIISRPPQSPYDILIVDAGENQGVKKDSLVTAFSEILLGRVVEVYPDFSKVKLISFPQEQTAVNLLNSNISANAIGYGGENLYIELPDSIEVSPNDTIVTQGLYPLAIGVIEKTEINTSQSLKKFFFRLPVNLQELKYVLIEKK